MWLLQLLLGLHVGRGLEALDSLQERLGIARRIIAHDLLGETGVDRLNVFLEGGTGLSLDLLYLFQATWGHKETSGTGIIWKHLNFWSFFVFAVIPKGLILIIRILPCCTAQRRVWECLVGRRAAVVRAREGRRTSGEYFSMPFCSLFADPRCSHSKCTIEAVWK